MKNITRNKTKGGKIVKVRILTAVGGFILCVLAIGDHITSIMNNFKNLNNKPTTVSVVPVMPQAYEKPLPVQPYNNRPGLSSTPFNPVIQASTNDQSPNLNNIHGSVRLQFGSANGQNLSQKQLIPLDRSISAGAIDRASLQISTGAQSPNINAVDKDVEINFNAPNNTTTNKN